MGLIERPLVSIITPSFNRADLIKETSESVFSQTYHNWEWIVVDDGSSDETSSIFEQLIKKDKRIKFIKRELEPKGACTCRNIGVEVSNGEYLLFLDSDDLLSSICLEQRVNAFSQKRENDFMIFPTLLFKDKYDDLKLLWNIEKSENDILRIFYGDAICQGTGVIWSKKSFVKLGMWNQNLKVWQDVELHLRAMFEGLLFSKHMNYPPDVFIRINDLSISRTNFHSKSKLQSRIKVFQLTLDLNKKYNFNLRFENGFRFMSLDLIISAIESNFWAEFWVLMSESNKEKLFSIKDSLIIVIYAIVRFTRVYKITILNLIVKKYVSRIVKDKIEVTLGTHKYTGKITI